MQPFHSGADKKIRGRSGETNDADVEHLPPHPGPEEQRAATFPLPVSSATGQNISPATHQAALLRIQQLHLVEQQRRQLQAQMMFARRQAAQIDPRLFGLSIPNFLGSHPTSSLTTSDAALAAIMARRRIEHEHLILLNHQRQVPLDANRLDQLIAMEILPNTTGPAPMAPTGILVGGGSAVQGSSPREPTPSFSTGLASLRQEPMCSTPYLPPSTRQVRHLSFPLPQDPLTTDRNQAQVSASNARHSPQSTTVIDKRDKSSLPANSLVNNLMERYTSGGTKEASFPLKLHSILSNPENHDFIHWLPHGRSWRIVRVGKFEEEVIPRYFRHAKYASFMRQVNGWEFHRNALEENSYSHPLFLRDDPAQCLKMVRYGATKNAAGQSIKAVEGQRTSISSGGSSRGTGSQQAEKQEKDPSAETEGSQGKGKHKK